MYERVTRTFGLAKGHLRYEIHPLKTIELDEGVCNYL